ncbi:MAG: GntR family transcriptional regulator [Planctomycetota bacterium]
MNFRCDTASRVPIYKQLMEQVRTAVARKAVRPGERLPSIRQLSRTLVINPNTVAKAYVELEREGLITRRQGLGVFITAASPEMTAATRRKKLRDATDRYLTEAVHLGVSADEVRRAIEERSAAFHFAGDDGGPGGE